MTFAKKSGPLVCKIVIVYHVRSILLTGDTAPPVVMTTLGIERVSERVREYDMSDLSQRATLTPSITSADIDQPAVR